MEYVAVKRGFRHGRLIEAKETFEADDFKGSWAVPTADYKPEKPKPDEVLLEEAKEALQGRKAASKGKKRGKRKASK